MLKVIELFGGIGALRAGLENANIDFEIVDYVEIDKYPVDVPKSYILVPLLMKYFDKSIIDLWNISYKGTDCLTCLSYPSTISLSNLQLYLSYITFLPFKYTNSKVGKNTQLRVVLI